MRYKIRLATQTGLSTVTNVDDLRRRRPANGRCVHEAPSSASESIYDLLCRMVADLLNGVEHLAHGMPVGLVTGFDTHGDWWERVEVAPQRVRM